MVNEVEISNQSNDKEAVTHTAALVFSVARTEETHWEHAFGIMLKQTMKIRMVKKTI